MEPERHRDYFRRELQVGRRIVAEWSIRERWPKDDVPHLRDIIFDGFEFRTEEDADRFNLDEMIHIPSYDLKSWEEAVQWVIEEPGT